LTKILRKTYHILHHWIWNSWS